MPSQFIIDLEGTELSAEEQIILQHKNVGGVILFTRNFTCSAQLKELTANIHAVNPALFIAVDHEGGNVQRFQRYDFHSIPCARSFGEVYDDNNEAGLKHAERYGKRMAEDLLKHGIDLSLAPVLDLDGQSDIIGKLDRAFHAHPDAVTKLGEAFIKGMNTVKMPAVGKHFPGHGSFTADSHIAQPISKISKKDLEEKEMKPFATLIKNNALSAVMPAHVTYTMIDKNNTTTFSKIWLHDILREKLGFKGLVISDCLSMKGADIGDLAMRAEKALTAGCDMLIVSHQPRDLLLKLIQSITAEQSPESAARIEAFKKKMPRFSNKAEISLSSHSVYAAKRTEDFQPEQYDSLNTTRTI